MIDLDDFQMRAPCSCGETAGRVVTKNGQDTVRCRSCDKYAGYNLPKSESGKEQRSVTRNRVPMKPSKKAEILMRDGYRCVLCRVPDRDTILEVGHLISHDIGLRVGMTKDEVNDDENLAAMCEECNAGLSNQPIPLPTAVWIVRARISWRNSRGAK